MADARKAQARAAAPRGGPPPGRDVAVKVHPAIEEAGGLTKFISQYTGNFGRVVPSHIEPDSFIALAVAYVERDAKLKEAATANPKALVLALRECAVLGHLPISKIFALVPFRDNSPNSVNGWAIAGIETYWGVVERMYRAGGIQSIRWNIVRRNDRFEFDFKTQTVLRHDVDPMASTQDRGPIAGAYAYAVMMAGGTSRAVWMNEEELLRHKAMAKTPKFWDAWPEPMRVKTVLHGLENAVPTSAEYRTAIAKADAAATRELGPAPAVVEPTPGPGTADPRHTFVDGDVVDDDEAPAASQDGRHEADEAARVSQDPPQDQGGQDGSQADPGAWSEPVAQPGGGNG